MKKKEVRKLIEHLIAHNDVCERCKEMGQILPECPCETDKDCAKHILKLWELNNETD